MCNQEFKGPKSKCIDALVGFSRDSSVFNKKACSHYQNFGNFPSCSPFLTTYKKSREDATIQYPARLIETLEYPIS